MDEHCPGCVPNEDPETYVVAWCGYHMPDRSGAEDAKVPLAQAGVGMIWEGGEDGEQWCDLIHRGTR